MVQRHKAETGNFVGDTLSALGIGVWSWRGSPQNVNCCPVAARLFGLPSAEAWNGLPLERFKAGVHPEDRAYFSRLVSRAMQTGGPFVAEYRTVDASGATRLIVDRGEFQRGFDGHAVAACGVLVDVTDRSRGIEIENSVGGLTNLTDSPPLLQAVEHALALHKLLGVLPEEWRNPSELMIKTVLEMLGRELAASLARDESYHKHPRGRVH